VTPTIRVAPLPSMDGWGNPYARLFYDALRPLGFERVAAVEDSVEWFRTQFPRIHWVHVHFALYFYNNRSLWLSLKGCVRFILFLVRLRFMGVRVAWTCHNLFPHESRNRVVDWVVRVALARVAHVVIVHSRAARRDIALRFGRFRRVVYIPIGHLVGYYPNSMSRAEARSRLGIPTGATTYLMLGHIRPYKGVEELIHAFRRLPDPDGVLVLAGRVAPEFSAREAREYQDALIARAAGDPRIRMHFGFIDDDDMQLYFNAADISVLPFRRVLTSFSLLLSMSFGVPVLVPRIAAIIEYVNDRVAYVMAPRESLTDALGRAKARRLSGELQSGAPVVQWVLRFDWNEAARSVAQAFV
jgi:beta-1,4-mannosyltransferase